MVSLRDDQMPPDPFEGLEAGMMMVDLIRHCEHTWVCCSTFRDVDAGIMTFYCIHCDARMAYQIDWSYTVVLS